MYGKHFESMYEGSMYGSGVAIFAVWGFVISHARAGRLELNPKKLADTLGGTVAEIEEAILKLQKPDPASRHKEFEGRRLIKEGEYQYFLPSWESYQTIQSAEAQREYNRRKQAEYRAEKKKKDIVKSKPSPGEPYFCETGKMPDDKPDEQNPTDIPDSVRDRIAEGG